MWPATFASSLELDFSETYTENLTPDGKPFDLGDVDAVRQRDDQGLSVVGALDRSGVKGAGVRHDLAGGQPLMASRTLGS